MNQDRCNSEFRPPEKEEDIGVLGPPISEPARPEHDPGRNYGGLPDVSVELPEPERPSRFDEEPEINDIEPRWRPIPGARPGDLTLMDLFTGEYNGWPGI
jgi:hypothetical protein